MRDFAFRLPLPVVLALIGASLWTASLCRAQPAPETAGPPSSTTTPPSSTTTPAPTAAAEPSTAGAPASLEALAWLRGCWLGSVNRREFLEQWSAPRGGMMVGFSHTVVAPASKETAPKAKTDAADQGPIDHSKDRTQDFEYLRLEKRSDGVYYVAVPSGKRELSFRLSDVREEQDAKIFTFSNVVDEFPQRIVYRRGTQGWLYAEVHGKPDANRGDVIYPMRHVDCGTGELLNP